MNMYQINPLAFRKGRHGQGAKSTLALASLEVDDSRSVGQRFLPASASGELIMFDGSE